MNSLISFLLKNIPRKYLQYFSHFFLRIVAIFYAGRNVECPVCKNQFRKFLPYGRKSRDNALCPNCLALERHRLMWLYLERKTPFFQDSMKVLHIAPELCFIERFKGLENLSYTTADLESPLAEVKMDIHQMPFEDSTFDVVFCNHVMEHVEDDHQAMKEVRRVLKEGGWAIMQIPIFHPIPETTFEDPTITDPRERERLFGQDDHVRLYGKDYPDRLKKAGFTVEKVDLMEEIGSEDVLRFALPTDDPLFICHSK